MAVAEVQVVTGSATSAGSVSVNITATVGNLLLIEYVGKGGNAALTSVTVGGNAATKIGDGTTNQEAPRAEAWYYYVTSGSSVTVTATMGGSPSELRIGVTELSGAASSSPVDVVGSRFYQSSASPSVSMTTTTANCMLRGVICHKGTTITWGSGQTQSWVYTNQGGGSYKMSTTTGSYTMSGTVSANWTCMIAYAIKPASGTTYNESLALSGAAAVSESAAATLVSALALSSASALAGASSAVLASGVSLGAGAVVGPGSTAAMSESSSLAAVSSDAYTGGLVYAASILLEANPALQPAALATVLGTVNLQAGAAISPESVALMNAAASRAADAGIGQSALAILDSAMGLSAVAALSTSDGSGTTYAASLAITVSATINQAASAMVAATVGLQADAAATAAAQAQMVSALQMAVAAVFAAAASEASDAVADFLQSTVRHLMPVSTVRHLAPICTIRHMVPNYGLEHLT